MPAGARHLPRTACALLAALLVAGALAGCGSGGGGSSSTALPLTGPGGFEGAELPGGLPAAGFTLHDQHGTAVSLSALRGHAVVLAFLRTGCRACTLIAQQLRGALDQLSEPAPVLIVSVDPAADTPAAVQSFLAATGLAGRARYLTGPASALPAVWRDYHVTTPSAAGQAAFERGAIVVLIDRSGRERVLYGQEQLTPEVLAHDIGQLQTG